MLLLLPLLVASSNKAVSTEAAGRWTYLTTLPLMKTFLTALYKVLDGEASSKRDNLTR